MSECHDARLINRPHANTEFCKFFNRTLAELADTKTLREISAELGYERPNFLTMVLAGDTRFPLDKVPALANALQVDPKLLFKLALESHFRALGDFLNEIFPDLAH